jgi:hypothetical protein
MAKIVIPALNAQNGLTELSAIEQSLVSGGELSQSLKTFTEYLDFYTSDKTGTTYNQIVNKTVESNVVANGVQLDGLKIIVNQY